MQDRTFYGWIVVSVALVAACGCGDPHPTTPVEGTIRLDGKPLVGVEVIFAPFVNVEAKSSPFSRDLTDENGHFALKCDNHRVGAVMGKHYVIVRRPVVFRRPDDPSPSKPRGPNIPAVYESLADTPLKIDVDTKQSVYDLDLHSKRTAKSLGK